MATEFPNLRYIWLTRRDKVRQAVSYYRAIKTGEWWKIAGVHRENPQPEPKFDFDYIRRLETLILQQEWKWQKYFEEFDIEPLVLIYEEFSSNVRMTIQEVLTYLQIREPRKLTLPDRL